MATDELLSIRGLDSECLLVESRIDLEFESSPRSVKDCLRPQDAPYLGVDVEAIFVGATSYAMQTGMDIALLIVIWGPLVVADGNPADSERLSARHILPDLWCIEE